MTDSTLPLNPVTPLYQGAAIASTNPLAVTSIVATGGGWLYYNTATGSAGGFPQVVKASAGTIHGLSINAISTLGSVQLVDAAATAASPIIATVPMTGQTTLFFDANTTAGILMIVSATSTATVPNITLSYK